MPQICIHCGYEGKGHKIRRGSRGMEIFLWTVLLVPGPFYTLWRICAPRSICPHCRHTTMVSLKSAEGQIKQLEILREAGMLETPALKRAEATKAEPEPAPAPRPLTTKKPVDPDMW